MRGSIFYDSSRHSALETTRNFDKHREKLDLINSRLHSTMCKERSFGLMPVSEGIRDQGRGQSCKPCDCHDFANSHYDQESKDNRVKP